jgi:hypothetical protein
MKSNFMGRCVYIENQFEFDYNYHPEANIGVSRFSFPLRQPFS